MLPAKCDWREIEAGFNFHSLPLRWHELEGGKA
jgi:hypothetical protein